MAQNASAQRADDDSMAKNRAVEVILLLTADERNSPGRSVEPRVRATSIADWIGQVVPLFALAH
jgi:hypothetical protein